jgi:reactive intermediate/imine deaminase
VRSARSKSHRKEAVVNVQQIRIEPDPYAPYLLSQGMRVGDLLLISGQTGIDDAGELVSLDDFDAQADQAFRNLSKVLEAGGSSLDRVAKVTIFLTDMAANFPKVVELRRKWFTPPYPADTIVEVRSLYRPEVMLEIEAIAVA